MPPLDPNYCDLDGSLLTRTNNGLRCPWCKTTYDRNPLQTSFDRRRHP